MPGRIRLLDEDTINKIAAGEVIERPASVVKELVENAIDAGSSRIEIAIRDAGLELIAVNDNGCGMTGEEGRLALLRHATSKISTADDLWRLDTLGFRGEALASIAAVADVEITTRCSDNPSGSRLLATGGEITVEDCGCPPGTKISVSGLFQNTPVRKKFLRSPATETGQISDVIQRLVLAHPEIAFQYRQENRVALATTGNNNLRDCLLQVYGREVARAMLPVDVTIEGLRITGMLALPEITRSNRNYLTFLVNGRYIKSHLLNEALEAGYYTFLPVNRYPVAVLNLIFEPGKVDANVHPAKMQVRFANPAQVTGILTKAVRETLQAGATTVTYRQFDQTPTGEKPNRPAGRLWESSWQPPGAAENRTKGLDYGLNFARREFSAAAEEPFIPAVNGPVVEVATSFANNNQAFGQPLVIGQHDNSYLLVAMGADLLIIDQHAAHERILYEQFRCELANREIPAQMLLLPLTVELGLRQKELTVAHALLLRDLGFIIEHFGGGTFIIRSVPQELKNVDEKQLFLDLLEEFAAGREGNGQEREAATKTMACRGAIKAGDRLQPEEAAALVVRLFQTEQPLTCPHGRPTMVTFPKEQLQQNFLRPLKG